MFTRNITYIILIQLLRIVNIVIIIVGTFTILIEFSRDRPVGLEKRLLEQNILNPRPCARDERVPCFRGRNPRRSRGVDVKIQLKHGRKRVDYFYFFFPPPSSETRMRDVVRRDDGRARGRHDGRRRAAFRRPRPVAVRAAVLDARRVRRTAPGDVRRRQHRVVLVVVRGRRVHVVRGHHVQRVRPVVVVVVVGHRRRGLRLRRHVSPPSPFAAPAVRRRRGLLRRRRLSPLASRLRRQTVAVRQQQRGRRVRHELRRGRGHCGGRPLRRPLRRRRPTRPAAIHRTTGTLTRTVQKPYRGIDVFFLFFFCLPSR